MQKKSIIFGIMLFCLGMVSLIFTGQEVSASAINDYIVSNKIEPVSVTYREGTFNNWYCYENGVGKPEGVVVHDTAVDGDSAHAEEQSFNNHWQQYQAYVHAFVDAGNIIQIHNTDYIVWGAGPIANSKFIQVELCHSSSKDAFARSVANDAYYIASKLIQYHLADTPGKTVLSHKQTAQMWHQTNHVDPDEYFVRFGYDMNQFNDLISLYYNNLQAYHSVYGNTTNNAGVSARGVITVDNKNGNFVPLVAFDANGKTRVIENRGLANNTPWYTDQVKNYAGVDYCRVATNEWVAKNYVV